MCVLGQIQHCTSQWLRYAYSQKMTTFCCHFWPCLFGYKKSLHHFSTVNVCSVNKMNHKMIPKKYTARTIIRIKKFKYIPFKSPKANIQLILANFLFVFNHVNQRLFFGGYGMIVMMVVIFKSKQKNHWGQRIFSLESLKLNTFLHFITIKLKSIVHHVSHLWWSGWSNCTPYTD